MSEEDIFAFKTAALLHTLPLPAVKDILKGTVLEKAVDYLETWPPRLIETLNTSYPPEIPPPKSLPEKWPEGKVENPLIPIAEIRRKDKFTYVAEKPTSTETFKTRLNEALKNIRDPAQAYNALYALLEPFYSYTLGSPGPPGHLEAAPYTALDLSYAAAAAANWYLEGEEPKGCIAYIDVASVQTFISSSRRPSDYRTASLIVSLLAWSTVRQLIEKHGADIMLIPTARLNPFFYYWVMKNFDLDEYLEGFYSDLHLSSDAAPTQSLINSTTTLILPPHACPITGKITNNYNEAWRKIVKKAATVLENLGLKEELLDSIEDYLNLIEDVPPLRLRTRIKNIAVLNEELRSYKISENKHLYNTTLYHYAVSKTASTKPGHQSIRIAVGAPINWVEITRAASNRENSIYRLCSNCALLPAVIRHVKRGTRDYIQVWKKGEGYVDIEDQENLAKIIKEREGLCPYCLVKRALGSRPDILEELATEIIAGTPLERQREEKGKRWPSTADIAMIPALLELTEKIQKIDEEEAEKLSQLIANKYMGGQKPLLRLPSIPELNREIREKLNFLEREKIGKKTHSALLRLIFSLDIEEHILEESHAPLYRELIRRNLLSKRYLYYAIVQADGDDVGELIKGKIPYKEKDQFLSPSKYYSTSSSNSLVIHMSNIRDILGKPTLLVTPAYHQVLSKALLATALHDREIIENAYGFPIYLGGDDLTALLPAAPPKTTLLKVVADTRKNYWPTSTFHEVGKIKTPALMARGRSYSVTIAHYRDPLPMLLHDTKENLEYIKSRAPGEKDGFYILHTRKKAFAETVNNEDQEDYENAASTLNLLHEIYIAATQYFSESLLQDLLLSLTRRRTLGGLAMDSSPEFLAYVAEYLTYIAERNLAHPSYKNKAKEIAEKIVKILGRRNSRLQEFYSSRIEALKNAITILLIVRSGEKP